MSNLYATEPATNGKVIIETTAGEIEIELWGKEAPKAVRNFLGLSMEGYYDGVIFHRVVPGFIIQTGDPTGTGMGGESFYGEPFADETHGRLKFNRRGLLGMANNGARNTNTSQFFITLDAAEELTNKHTLWGKVVGNTIFNVLSIGNLDLDAEEKPLVPPKIRRVRIIENPFDDIVPRITAAERKAQQQARIEAKKDLELRERRAKAKKNTKLLSFGEAEETPEEEVLIKKKSMTRKDLIDPADALSTSKPKKPTQSFVDLPESLKGLGEGSSGRQEKKDEIKATVDLREIRAQHEREKAGGSAARQADIARLEADLRRLKKRTGDDSDSDSDTSTRGRRPQGPSVLEQELAKYSSARGRAAVKAGKKRGRKDEEDDLLMEMNKFSKRVTAAEAEEDEAGEGVGREAVEEERDVGLLGEEEEGIEVDDDVGWMRHRLKFVVDEKELTRRAEEEYSVIDPRAKAKELESEMRGKNQKGGRGKRTIGDVSLGRRV